MTILRKSREFNTEQYYTLLLSPEADKMQLLDGSEIKIVDYVIYEDLIIAKNGEKEPMTILSIKEESGRVFKTNSDSFRQEFENILDMLEDLGKGEEHFTIRVASGKSKNDRKYYYCVMTFSDNG